MKAVFPAFDGFGLTTLDTADLATPALDAKRVLDVAAALVLILLFSPLLALVTLAIMAESRGPVIFCQRRTGLHGKTFGIFKF
ncbi:MAG: sugar transferase, partial [Verrucomicrobiaceae bacterium]